MRKWIPLDFGPKPIISSKDAAKGQNIIDSFFVGKISYYMVMIATSFCDSGSKTETIKERDSVYKSQTKRHRKLFFGTGHFGGLRNFCRSLFRPPSSDTESSRN